MLVQYDENFDAKVRECGSALDKELRMLGVHLDAASVARLSRAVLLRAMRVDADIAAEKKEA